MAETEKTRWQVAGVPVSRAEFAALAMSANGRPAPDFTIRTAPSFGPQGACDEQH
jgi:hypothetical protein